jgi:hypothetical protein
MTPIARLYPYLPVGDSASLFEVSVTQHDDVEFRSKPDPERPYFTRISNSFGQSLPVTKSRSPAAS